jgi:hypothetical protein
LNLYRFHEARRPGPRVIGRKTKATGQRAVLAGACSGPDEEPAFGLERGSGGVRAAFGFSVRARGAAGFPLSLRAALLPRKGPEAGSGSMMLTGGISAAVG